MGRRAVVLAGALLLAACGGEPVEPRADPAPASAAPTAQPRVPGVAAEAVRLRTDEAVGGRVQVRVTHTGGAPYTVTGVALDAPGFAPLPPSGVTAGFVPGRVIDLPTPYGEAVCPAGSGAPVARLTLARPDGSVEEVRVPLEGDALARVHAEECRARAVAEAVELRVDGLQAGPERLTGRLALARLGADDEVVVGRVGGNVQFDVAAELPLELPAGAATTAGAVTFTPATCDAHVLAEVKQPHLFPVGVRIGERPEVVVDLPVDDGLREALTELVRQVCRRA
ncbi:hypothetical protein QOZ88_01440 [Blastococcus sp. BMG 814]|uniref:Uncharacterized protein n=1 Tax=Blastococcus carthaginiensis TaxID=3050034 RepID=A0ABT9I6U6_9ACTN|nr:hypothetical protein [Blastococcus carthaginiensis]MDP5181289.1 hypothetical protein [Blastococcus carthaginiensis]